MDPKELEVTPEEHTAEQEALTEVQEDELRTKIAEDMGLDPETDQDLLDKIVNREKASRERTSKAIKQKIKYREQLKKTSEKSKSETTDPGKSQTPDIDALVNSKVNEALEARDLRSLQLNDELKEEVKDLAKLKGISVKEASELPYIKSRREQIEQEQKILESSPKRKGGGNYKPTYDVSKGSPDPDEFDLNAEEGRKAYKEAREAYRASIKSE